jgi:hypothetical protein
MRDGPGYVIRAKYRFRSLSFIVMVDRVGVEPTGDGLQGLPAPSAQPKS